MSLYWNQKPASTWRASERLPGARYRVIVYGSLVSPIPDTPFKEQAMALTEIIHHYFEDWIKEYPQQ